MGRETISNCQKGGSLLEIIVGMFLLAIMGMALAKSSVMTLTTREDSLRTSQTMLLAMDSLELFASRDPATLSEADDEITNFTSYSRSYTRVVDVTQNADQSVTVNVLITSDTIGQNGSAELSVKLVPWGAV